MLLETPTYESPTAEVLFFRLEQTIMSPASGGGDDAPDEPTPGF